MFELPTWAICIFNKLNPSGFRKIFKINKCSLGLAFVDFNDEVAAAKALIKTDGMKVGVEIIWGGREDRTKCKN